MRYMWGALLRSTGAYVAGRLNAKRSKGVQLAVINAALSLNYT